MKRRIHFGRGAGRTLLLAMTLAAAAVAALIAAQPSNSARPTIVVSEVDFHQSVPFLCGFPLERSVTGQTKLIDYGDGRIRVLSLHLVDTWTNPLTGKSLSSPSPSVESVESFADGTVVQAIVGVRERFVVPGEGAVVLVAGREVITYNVNTFDPNDPSTFLVTVFEAGPHEGLRDICPFLAG